MSPATDAQIELLRRQGLLPSDYSLEPDYGGPKTTLESVDEFLKDLPSNLTLGLIPKANPYGRLTEQERREVDAGRAASVQEAIEKSVEAQAKETKQQKREDNAYETDQLFKLIKDLNKETGQQNLDLIREQGRVTTQENLRQAAAMFPLLDLAGQRGTERALSASQRYRAFKEQLPSSVQAIMASKQAQLASASNAFAAEAQAIANQQQAATGFAQSGLGKYAGRRIA
tara:strand:- start:10 stop:696 length:687 start_codon:yes stop_codon:yes gene_type:complete